MVKFKCVEKNCSLESIEINFMGEIAEAICGGCHVLLQSYDQRPDPELSTE